MRVMVDAGLTELSPQCARLGSRTGRPSMAPEKLRRAALLQGLSTVRRARLLRAQRNDHRLLRWVVGLNLDAPLWEPSTFSKNRERWLEGDVAPAVFDQGLAPARDRDLRSDAHVTGDGTLLEAWAGPKSCTRKEAEPPSPPPEDPGNPRRDFRGERRPNVTPVSTTAPDARLDKTAHGQEAKLAYLGQVRMEHRPGLVVATHGTPATGTAERAAALAMAEAMAGHQRVTLGADKPDDTRDFVRATP
jgi:transposase